MFLATTIWTYIPIENVKAAPPEIPLDKNFIERVVKDLADIAGVYGDTYWMGREFGSIGEQHAADNILEDLWNDYIAEDETEYAELERIDKWATDGIDDKLDIVNLDDYYLEIDNKVIDKQSCYPIPCYKDYYLKDGKYIVDQEFTVRKTPNRWYSPPWSVKKDTDLELMELKEELKKEQMLYEVEYLLLNDSGGVAGDVVYIEDYENASINETEGRIHLIEIDQNACDDVFNDMINKVYDSNGTAYIAVVTNPSFMDKKKTAIPGVAISRYDGEKIKQSLKESANVSVKIEGDSTPVEGILEVYCIKEISCQNDYIYLIDLEKVDKSWFTPRSLLIVDVIYFRSILALKPAKAFLICDMNSDTHHMYPAYGLQGDPREDIVTTLKRNIEIPGFCINGTLGGQINDGAKVDFKITASHEEDAKSYNVIGEIPGSHDGTVIVSAHYDSYWGQCAMDDASGVGVVWGIAKYIKDNDITPYYTMKFIAFGGEEYGTRGSKHYVWKHVLPQGSDKIVAVINLDPIAMKTKDIDPDDPPIPFSPWIYPGIFNSAYWKILEAMNLEYYGEITRYNYKKPHMVIPTRAGKIAGGDLGQFTDLDGNPKADYLIELERMTKYNKNAKDLAFFDHRSGENFQKGDIWTKVDTNDLYETAKMTLRLVQLIAISADLDFVNDCTYIQLDLDSDGYYDSVKIGFDVTTNISSWGKVESVIYQNGQAQTTSFKTDLLNISQNYTTSGNLTVTLPPNATAGNCDIRVYLRDFNGSQDDFDNTTLYLYPYNHSVADFTWERNSSNMKMINFTDLSMPSPNATLTSWNWSFGDGNYSNLQNCSHNYSNMGTFNVTLTVTDSANKSANVTKQVETFSTAPISSFTVNSSIILVNKTLTLNSTSFDVDGSIVNTTWYFGDNTTGYGANITHTYNKSGFYTVSLYATDDDNSTANITKIEHILVVDAFVDDGFIDDPVNHKWDSIQEGINDVSDDGTIYVYNGVYLSYLVNKSVSIYGESKDSVLIDPQPIGIDVQYHDVYIKNFTINGGLTGVNIIGTRTGACNVTIENGAVLDPIDFGVYIDNSTNNTIKGCKIDDAVVGIKICNGAEYNVIDDCNISNCYHGVSVDSSSYNWIGNPSINEWYPNDCVFTLNTNAVYLRESDHNYILGCDIDATPPPSEGPPSTRRGIYLDEASNTTISTCNIFNATQGIYIKDSRDNKVEFCRIFENSYGIEFFGADAEKNLIAQNNITSNSQYGVYLPPFPKCNKVLYNDFFDNGNGETNQSYDAQTTPEQTNSWCKQGPGTLTEKGPGEGNYWKDYTGVDLNSDGVGDSEYGVVGDGEDDYYPLMEPYGWCTGTSWD